jgi:ATP-dependent DNA helicase RecG
MGGPDPDALLRTPLPALVGGATAKRLASLGLHTGGDLLWHLPRRYIRRGQPSSLGELRTGEYVTVLATVLRADERRMRNRPGWVVTVEVTDGVDSLELVFFKRRAMPWPLDRLLPGRQGLFVGQVTEHRGAGRPRRQLAHPDFEMLTIEVDGSAESAATLERFAAERLPVYPAGASASSLLLQRSVRVVLDQLGELDDPLPADLRAARNFPGLSDALRAVHDPRDEAVTQRAWARLKFTEAFLLQLELVRRRRAAAALPARARVAGAGGVRSRLDSALPFPLTGSQQRVGDRIDADLARPHPMHRLLQGDVGSGKTLVALRAMLTVVDAGAQAALLAPTEVLAQQHYRSLTDLLGPLASPGMLGGDPHGVRITLLTGAMTVAARRRALLEIASGEAGIVVGTHALLQESVQFADLGLVVVDEQHRFGVEQRAALAVRAPDGLRPHVLVMTATPIPRTVAMTVFGDLDVAVLEDLPPGRRPVQTFLVPADRASYLERTWARVREEVAGGRRVFVVCPRIGDDPTQGDVANSPGEELEPADGVLFDDAELGLGAEEEATEPTGVLALAAQLREGPLAELPLGVLHGRMTPERKDQAMADFRTGRTPVLVATTVVEVGVDVPEASMMVIVDADRFGVSQLHQLRGRIGRGTLDGLCLLLTQAPPGSPAWQRLQLVADTSDGFALAEADLARRREGDVLGTAQTGLQSSLRLVSVRSDRELIRDARAEAELLLESDPDLSAHPGLAAALRTIVDDRGVYLETG